MWRIGIAFLIGLCCVHLLPSLPSVWPWACVLVLLIGAAAALRQHLCVVVLLGVAWAWAHAQWRASEDLPAGLEGQDLVVTGRIASLPDLRDQDPQFEFALGSASVERVPATLRLAWYDAETQPRVGELWQFVVRLKRRSGFANPGGFDYEGYLFRSGIGATGYIRDDARNLRLAPAGAGYPMLQMRAWLAQRIADAAGDTPMLGILQGLAVGDTRAMLPQQWRVFGATGTTHLMAISGLHISMVAALAATAGGMLARWRGAQRRRWTAIHGQVVAGILAALAYSLLAGMSIPTQRTLVMLCIYFAARWARRELNAANALGLALVGVLIVDPFAPLTLGAWLSFGAVAVILLAAGGRLRRERAIANFARVQWAVTLGLLPILVVGFGGLSLVSPVANAVAVPFFTLLIVPLVLLGTAVSALWVPGGEFVFGFTAYLLEGCWPALTWLAELPLAMWHFPQMTVMHYAALACGALLLVLPGAWPARIAGLALCMPAIVYRPATPAPGDYAVTVLDVGQGLAVVVRTHAHVLVYDAGPAFSTGRDTGELVVVPYLRSLGVRSLDRLMISHGDLDHRGGMKSILASMPVDSVLAGPSVHDSPVPMQRCVRSQRWQWDGVEFDILHPDSSTPHGDNNTSCVLRISGAAGATLLTGDIEAQAELELARRELPPADIVVIPHHGSRSSSSEAFVSATHARLALVSAGYRNRWSFPKPDVVERWSAAGAQVRSTIDGGALEITVARSGIVSRQHRREQRHYWSAR